jgi:small subunit ribosomal protein S2
LLIRVCSLRSAALIAMVLGKAGARGLQRRKDDAENGQVNWETPRDVQQYITVEMQRKAAEIQRARKEAEGEDGKPLREDPLDNETFRELFEPPHLR